MAVCTQTPTQCMCDVWLICHGCCMAVVVICIWLIDLWLCIDAHGVSMGHLADLWLLHGCGSDIWLICGYCMAEGVIFANGGSMAVCT